MNSSYLNYPKCKIAWKPGISNEISDIPNISFYIGEYMASSCLTRQWRHQKLEVDIFRERKLILQCDFFFVRYYFWCLKTYLFFIFCVSLPLILFAIADFCRSIRRAGPFVGHFIILSEKIILNQGLTY